MSTMNHNLQSSDTGMVEITTVIVHCWVQQSEQKSFSKSSQILNPLFESQERFAKLNVKR